MLTSANIGTELFKARRRRGLTLREAAAASGVSAQTLSRAERGGTLSLHHFEQVAFWIGDAGLVLWVPDECCVVA